VEDNIGQGTVVTISLQNAENTLGGVGGQAEPPTPQQPSTPPTWQPTYVQPMPQQSVFPAQQPYVQGQQPYPQQGWPSWQQVPQPQPVWNPQLGQYVWPAQQQMPQQMPQPWPSTWPTQATPHPQETQPSQLPVLDEREAFALSFLRDHDSVGPRDLNGLMPLSESTWSRVLARLESSGLVSKQGGQKRRLTDAGRSYLGM
jgi:hypothetical protein